MADETQPHLKVVSLTQPKPKEVRMPTQRDIETILQGEALRGLILVVVTEEDNVGYYRANLSDHEAVGIMEETKLMLFEVSSKDEFELED